jgi:ligand-binding SRPBCC domain-containing protein
MKIYTFERTVDIKAPIQAVYDFHLDVKNLSKISPPNMTAELVKSEGLGLGRMLYLRITQFGFFKSRWVVRIDEYDPPYRLTDMVLKGPFPYFRHTRTFSQPHIEFTKLHDKLEYALPFGFIGRLANKLSVRKMIEQMFVYRHMTTKQLLESKFYLKEMPIE